MFKKIKCIFILVTTLFCAYFSQLGLATPSSNDNAAHELANLLGHYQSYEANFKQVTYANANHRMSQHSRGKIMMLRPGKFRWERNNPTKQIVIANGDTLWIYDVDLQQATQEKISEHTTNPASLLTGNVSKLLSRFSVTRLPGSDTIFRLKPRSAKNNFQSVDMTFANRRLTRIKVINNLGQTSDFTFSNIRLNVKLSEKLFQFNPPPGVDVLKQ